MDIHGFCEEPFLPLKEAFRTNFDEGLELGSSLALTHRGKIVVDLWSGWADLERTRPWQRDTIVVVSSTTKIATAIALLILVDRGLIELDRSVASYWPEFAQGGKGSVTVRDALTHQAGVPGFDPPVPFEAQHDWDLITARLAAQPHWFDGRKVFCYHLITYGFLLGELIRRVDGRRPAQFFREEVAHRLGADFQIGLSSKLDLDRRAAIQLPAVDIQWSNDLARRVWTSIGPGDVSTWEHRSADIPAVNGYANGRSIARICAILALRGEVDGVRYLSSRMVDQAAELQVSADCPMLGAIRLGLGFGLDSTAFPAPTPTCFHWGGYGGSLGLMDRKTGVSFGYAPNNFLVDASGSDLMDPRGKRIWDALATVLTAL